MTKENLRPVDIVDKNGKKTRVWKRLDSSVKARVPVELNRHIDKLSRRDVARAGIESGKFTIPEKYLKVFNSYAFNGANVTEDLPPRVQKAFDAMVDAGFLIPLSEGIQQAIRPVEKVSRNPLVRFLESRNILPIRYQLVYDARGIYSDVHRLVCRDMIDGNRVDANKMDLLYYNNPNFKVIGFEDDDEDVVGAMVMARSESLNIPEEELFAAPEERMMLDTFRAEAQKAGISNEEALSLVFKATSHSQGNRSRNVVLLKRMSSMLVKGEPFSKVNSWVNGVKSRV